nr:uncharacterized protein LOC117691914 [Crassostrea gigas]
MDYKIMTLCVQMMLVNTTIFAQYKEEDPSVDCGHRLYFTNATWYTAYKLCEEENKELMILDSDILNFKSYFSLTIATRLLSLYEYDSSNLRVWVGAFLRISTNERMDSRCKPLNVDLKLDDQSQRKEDVFCLSYNYSSTEFHAESCDNKRSFVCNNPKNEKTNCMVTSNRTVINDSDSYVLCWQGKYEDFLESKFFAIILDNNGFVRYGFKSTERSCSKLYPKSNKIRHKKLQEKIETRKKNLTVHRKETNKYQRTLNSAPDDRPTSKNMGVIGALIISLAAGLFVCFDLLNFCRKCQPVRVKVE